MSDENAARSNIELKAHCHDLGAVARACERSGAVYVHKLVQVDTYFHAPHGRLKLRTIEGAPAELIGYKRADKTQARASEYRIVRTEAAATLRALLAETLGVRGEVRKRRDLWLWKNVRIHLDSVEGLGDFIEFEAVVSETDDASTGHARVAELMAALSINAADIVSGSYSDLMGW